MRKYLLVALIVGAVLGVGGFWYWSPYIALNDMRTAVRDADPDRLNAHIDYPQLRESLKGQLSALMMKEVAKASNSGSEMERIGSSLGSMLGLAMVDRMVDGMVRPEAVMLAMQSGKLRPGSSRRNAQGNKLAMAQTDIALMHQALKLYKLDHGAYPSQEQGLQALVDPANGPHAGQTYMETLPADPWGRPYQYRNPGNEPGTIQITHLPVPESDANATRSDDTPAWHLERKNADLVIVYAANDNAPAHEKTGFVLAREGFARWKLTEIRLPSSLIQP